MCCRQILFYCVTTTLYLSSLSSRSTSSFWMKFLNDSNTDTCNLFHIYKCLCRLDSHSRESLQLIVYKQRYRKDLNIVISLPLFFIVSHNTLKRIANLWLVLSSAIIVYYCLSNIWALFEPQICKALIINNFNILHRQVEYNKWW